MKKRIISIVAISLVVILAFTICVFAIDPTNYPTKDNYYGNSVEGCPTNTDCPVDNAYDEGFNEGQAYGEALKEWEKDDYYADYYSKEEHDTLVQSAVDEALADFKETDEFKSAVQAELQSYLGSTEYANALEELKQNAVDDYRINVGSQLIFQEYEAGFEAGTQAGYQQGLQAGSSVAYAEGYSAGANEFRGSEQYQNELQANAQAGYDMGYADGSSQASSSGTNDFTSLIWVLVSLLALMCVSLGLVLVVSKIKNRKVKRK